MHRRILRIGNWTVLFLFSPGGYDADYVLSVLYELDATDEVMEQAEDLMLSGDMNTGFTYVNPYIKHSLVVIGPTTEGAEFIDTVVHELYHLAVSIASFLGEDVRGETPAYMAGDSIRDLSDLVCLLGCGHSVER